MSKVWILFIHQASGATLGLVILLKESATVSILSTILAESFFIPLPFIGWTVICLCLEQQQSQKSPACLSFPARAEKNSLIRNKMKSLDLLMPQALNQMP